MCCQYLSFYIRFINLAELCCPCLLLYIRLVNIVELCCQCLSFTLDWVILVNCAAIASHLHSIGSSCWIVLSNLLFTFAWLILLNRAASTSHLYLIGYCCWIVLPVLPIYIRVVNIQLVNSNLFTHVVLSTILVKIFWHFLII